MHTTQTRTHTLVYVHVHMHPTQGEGVHRTQNTHASTHTQKAKVSTNVCTPYRLGHMCICAHVLTGPCVADAKTCAQAEAPTHRCAFSVSAKCIRQHSPEITPLPRAPCQPCTFAVFLQPLVPSRSAGSTQQTPAGQKTALWKQSGPHRPAAGLSAWLEDLTGWHRALDW